MNDYTPTEAIVREQYILSQERVSETPEFLIATRDHIRGGEFDRFVASVRAAALDEAAEVAENFTQYAATVAYPVAAAIRALKEEKK